VRRTQVTKTRRQCGEWLTRALNGARSTKSDTTVARALAWVGILAIIILSVVPAADRPVTGAGHLFEHLAAYALVAGVFAIGYHRSLIWTLLLAFFFCCGIELLQVPLPTRHARVTDFIIDFAGSCFAIGLVFAGNKLIAGHE
jgi:VanZ family protein